MTTTGRTISFRLDGPASDCRAVIKALEDLGAEIFPKRSPNRKRREPGVFWHGRFAVPADAPPPDTDVTSLDHPRAAKPPRQSATSRVAQRVRDRISKGKLRPGDRLPPITGGSGVRRAYQILRAEGLIEYVPGYGMHVAGEQPQGREMKAEATANLLRSQITSGTLPPGASLVLAEQAQRLGVSRQVVSAAYRVLTAEDIIERLPGRGSAYVVSGAPRRSQVIQAVDWIRSRIDSGVFAPGTALPVREWMMAATGVGQSSLAEAYRQLKTDGVICFIPARGMFVCGAEPEKQLSDADKIVEYLKHQIATSLAPGTRVPPYRQICEIFPVSNMTINRAVTRMKNANLLVSRSGKGIFVADTPEVSALRAQNRRA